MSITSQELKEIRRLLVLNYVEIQHLKKKLYEHLFVDEGDINDYKNCLEVYIKDLDKKKRNLVTNYPYLGD